MLAVTNDFLSTPREGSLVLTPNFPSPGNPLKQYRWKLSKEGAEGQAFLISSANKRKFSRGQRESRTRKETGRAESSGGRAEWLVTGTMLQFLGLSAKQREEGNGRELPQFLGTISCIFGTRISLRKPLNLGKFWQKNTVGPRAILPLNTPHTIPGQAQAKPVSTSSLFNHTRIALGHALTWVHTDVCGGDGTIKS